MVQQVDFIHLVSYNIKVIVTRDVLTETLFFFYSQIAWDKSFDLMLWSSTIQISMISFWSSETFSLVLRRLCGSCIGLHLSQASHFGYCTLAVGFYYKEALFPLFFLCFFFFLGCHLFIHNAWLAREVGSDGSSLSSINSHGLVFPF